MKVNIELGFISGTKIRQPFWMSGDKLIHLSTYAPKTELELELLSQENLDQLLHAIRMRDILTDNFPALMKECQMRITKQNILRADLDPYSVKIDMTTDDLEAETRQEALDGIVDKASKDEEVSLESATKGIQIKELAEKILSQNVQQLTRSIGKGEKVNGALPRGIDNLQTLRAMHKTESEKDKPRKAVLKLISDRIKAIESIAATKIDGEFEITDEEYIKVALGAPEQETEESVTEDKE